MSGMFFAIQPVAYDRIAGVVKPVADGGWWFKPKFIEYRA